MNISDKDRNGDNPSKTLPRIWTVRLTPPLKYRRYTANSDQGYTHIFIKFDEKNIPSRLPVAAFHILQEMKTLDGYPTGLKLVTDKLHGKVWRLPDNPVGRTAADIIDARLGKLAAEMTRDSSRQR